MTQQKNKSSKRIWIHVLWISLTVITLLIAALCIAAFRLFDSKPMTLDQEGTSPLLAFTVMQKGQKNMEMLQRANPMSVAKVEYTEDEFNFMARTMILMNNFSGKQVAGVTPENTSLIVKNGVFRIKHSMKTEGNPFGTHLNLVIELKLDVKDGVDTVEVISAKAGSYDLPKDFVQNKVNVILRQHYRGTAHEDIVKNSILKFKADGSNVILEYKPYTLLHDIDQIYFGGTGDFLRKMGHGAK